MNDIKYAARSFLKTPGFTAVVILTLALGVGATTAIFSVVNAVLLEPLPFANADRLVVARLSLPDYQDIKRATTSFDGMGVWATNLYNLKSGTDSQQVLGGVISPELMPLLGVEPIIGRNFTVEDERQESVILGFGLWQSRFGGDPSVLGTSIDLSGTKYTVVGVARSGFSFPTSEFQLWTPMGTIEAKAPAHATNRGLRIFNAIALLKPGVTVQQAQAEIAAQSETLARTYPATNQGVAITLEPLYERIVGNARPGLRVLFVTVALLLLIACANVANLMLARTTTRERELAIRAALGAGKGRLVRQVLTESLVLAVAGGALGLLVATWGVDALPAMLSGRLPRADRIRVDVTVMLFAMAATLVTAVCFGLVPALHVGAGPMGTLKEGGPGDFWRHTRTAHTSRDCRDRNRPCCRRDGRRGTTGPQPSDAHRTRSWIRRQRTHVLQRTVGVQTGRPIACTGGRATPGACGRTPRRFSRGGRHWFPTGHRATRDEVRDRRTNADAGRVARLFHCSNARFLPHDGNSRSPRAGDRTD